MQKQSREFNSKSLVRRQKIQNGRITNGAVVSTAKEKYPQARDNFLKPRAISKQTDAHIRIEVHKDQRIIHHLQEQKQENMNLMFYNFNDFNNLETEPQKRPMTQGSQRVRPGKHALQQKQK